MRRRRASAKDPYSHSIINDSSKLLTCGALAAASQIFAVIITVNLPGASIGAGLRAIRPKVTFRDLSTLTTISDAIDARPCGSGKRPSRADINHLKLFSRLAFSPILLPSRCCRSGGRPPPPFEAALTRQAGKVPAYPLAIHRAQDSARRAAGVRQLVAW